jgi:hypothetical protein
MDDAGDALTNVLIFVALWIITFAIYKRWLSKNSLIRQTVGTPSGC